MLKASATDTLLWGSGPALSIRRSSRISSESRESHLLLGGRETGRGRGVRPRESTSRLHNARNIGNSLMERDTGGRTELAGARAENSSGASIACGQGAGPGHRRCSRGRVLKKECAACHTKAARGPNGDVLTGSARRIAL